MTAETVATPYQDENAIRIAVRHIRGYEPFTKFPEKIAARGINFFWGALSALHLTRYEAPILLDYEIRSTWKEIWTWLATLPDLNDQRKAVLLHAAFLMTVERTRNIEGLDAALRKQNYEAAQDALLRSEWPLLAAPNLADRQRVLDLARMLRTGMAEPA